MAVLGTQTIATLIAVYGVFMTPLGWKWAGFVWGYALIWFLINDRIKLLAYRIFDPVKVSTKPSDKDVPKLDSKAASKPEAKAEPKPEAKPEGKDSPKPEAKTESKPETTAEPKSDDENKPKSEVTVEAKPESKAEPEPAAKAEAKPETKPDSKPDVKDDSNTETKVQPKPEAKTPPEATPQLVKRVHELYEQLGREDVKAVQEWEKANQDTRKNAPDEAHK
jgi:H+-transporting ATPase